MTAEEFAAMERRARMFEAANEKMLTDNKRLREENARLREALKPFAYIAEHVGEEDARWAVPSAHLRAAAAAIREGGND